jgi:hypothetical protein
MNPTYAGDTHCFLCDWLKAEKLVNLDNMAEAD